VRQSWAGILGWDLGLALGGIGCRRHVREGNSLTRQTFPGLPIVLHTLYGSNILEVEAEKNGISWVLPKWEGFQARFADKRILHRTHTFGESVAND
jgi:hypothetical protein